EAPERIRALVWRHETECFQTALPSRCPEISNPGIRLAVASRVQKETDPVRRAWLVYGRISSQSTSLRRSWGASQGHLCERSFASGVSANSIALPCVTHGRERQTWSHVWT